MVGATVVVSGLFAMPGTLVAGILSDSDFLGVASVGASVVLGGAESVDEGLVETFVEAGVWSGVTGVGEAAGESWTVPAPGGGTNGAVELPSAGTAVAALIGGAVETAAAASAMAAVSACSEEPAG